MPQENCDRAFSDFADPCPNCGAAMEPIGSGVYGPPLQKLRLCPACYLVTWSDQDGMHVRQGVPVKKGVEPAMDASAGLGWLAGRPKRC